MNKSYKSLFIIRLDAIGDFVIWLSAAKHFKTIYPNDRYKITLICSSVLVGFADNFPYWDEIIYIDKQKYLSNPIYRWHLRIKFLFSRVDLVVNPVFSRDYVTDKLILFLRCNQKIGFDGDMSNRDLRLLEKGNKIFSKLIKIPDELKTELEKNFEFINQISGLKVPVSLPELPPFVTTSKKDIKNYYIIVPGAGKPYRQWDINFFVNIINLIYQKTNWIGLICGSKNELKLTDEIVSKTGQMTKSITGETSLLELFSLIGESKFLISNETSATHIAAALNVPSVCILGGGHFGRFVPYPEVLRKDRNLPICVYNEMNCYNCNWKCIYTKDETKPYPCIASITVEQVWEKVDQLLENISVD